MKVEEGSVDTEAYSITYAGFSDIGKIRKINEDDFLILPQAHLFCVADGVGGLDAGDVASRTALAGVKSCFSSGKRSFFSGMRLLSSRRRKKNSLVQVFEFANSCVLKKKIDLQKKMATTLLVTQLTGTQAQIAHVGDSRVYLYRDNLLTQITKDHSLVAELHRSGAISENQIRNHPQGNVITRAIGAEREIRPSVQDINICTNDILLLCSDGLTAMLDDEKINEILMNYKGNINRTGEMLVEQANLAGGKDNITVMLIKIT